MDTYLKQLVDDFRQSVSRIPSPKDWLAQMNAIHNEPIDEINCCELYIDGSNDQILGDIVGIQQIDLPPDEKLTDKQLEYILFEFTEMLVAWHFVPCFQENVPLRLQYRLLRNTMSENHCFLPLGDSIMDFCNGNCPDCELNPYCSTAQEFD